MLAAPAGAWLGTQRKSADLDGDGSAETVRSVRIHVSGVTDRRFDSTAVDIVDTCNGKTSAKRIARPQDNLALMRLRDADGPPGREVFLALRPAAAAPRGSGVVRRLRGPKGGGAGEVSLGRPSGAAPRVGEARVVAWRKGPPCSTARALFGYKSDRHTRTPRGGTGDIAAFNARYRKRRG